MILIMWGKVKVSGVVVQEGDNFNIWEGTEVALFCSFIRQIIFSADPSILALACLKGPANVSAG